MYSEEDFLPLSGIQHFEFCRRQWALIQIEQQWADNHLTIAGDIMHETAHDNTKTEKRNDKIIMRGVAIKSRALGLSGICDIVEFIKNESGIQLSGYTDLWLPHLVEYKHGEPKQGDEDKVQLCAQAICLEEMLLCTIQNGDLYYGETKRRENVVFTKDLRTKTQQLADEMHDLYKKGYTPKVRPKKYCQSCSLNNICLPKLQKMQNVSQYITANLGI